MSSPKSSPRVLITGASSGIGEACAIEYAKAGAKLILAARRLDRLEALAERLQQEYGCAVLPYQLDVSDSAAVNDCIENLPAEWAPIDILINNAGLSSATCSIDELTVEQMDKMIDVNLKGLLYMTRAVLPQMRARNQGHLVNIGSVSAFMVMPQSNIYTATKHAVKAVTAQLRLDLLGTKIRVSEVDPGPVETEFSEKRWGDKARAKAFYERMEALTGQDIAEAVTYCTTRKSHINIDTMVVNSISTAGTYALSTNQSVFD